MTPEEVQEAWDFLRGEIDQRVKRSLDKSVYGVSGLSDVPEWYLWERLEKSGLRWELDIGSVTYHGMEMRKPASGGREYPWYLVSITGTLLINGRPFPCVGAGEGRRLDTAYKGALTSLFKNGCKWAGITMSIYKEAPIDDDYIGLDRSDDNAARSNVQSRSASLPAIQDRQEAKPATNMQPAPRKLSTDEFMANPVNGTRTNILLEFNKALPNAFGDNWVEAAINLWLSRSEEDALTDEMKNPKTGGSPINWVFHRLVATHYEQCSSSCSHVGEFHKKLIDAGKTE